jgi:hypothetical protein
MNEPTIILETLTRRYTDVRSMSGGAVFRPSGPALAAGFVAWPDGMRSQIDALPLTPEEIDRYDDLVWTITERIRARFAVQPDTTP